MLQQDKVVNKLLKSDPLIEKMPLKMRQLHNKGKLDRRRPKTFGHPLRIQNFAFQITLQARIRKRTQDARRRLEMNFNSNFARIEQMDMVRGVFTSFVKFETHLFHKGDNAFSSAIHPQVYIARMPHKRVRVKPCVCSPLQDSRLAPFRSKQFRIPRGFGVQKLIMSLDCLRLTRPLEHQS